MLYTDPGSGIMLLQILLAFGASAIFYFRKHVLWIFGRGTPDRKANSHGNDDE